MNLASVPLQKTASTDATQKKRILLVEDYQANILVATALLESFGYETAVARTGGEAINLIQKERFALVLMDIQMPDMDGFEATKRVRAYEKQHQLSALPIIAMTAHALAGDKERCLQAGMTDYIPKPFNPLDFESKMEKYAGAYRQPSPAANL